MTLRYTKPNGNLQSHKIGRVQPDETFCLFYPQPYLSLRSEEEIAEMELCSLFGVEIDFMQRPVGIAIKKHLLRNIGRLTFWEKVEVLSDGLPKVMIPNQVLFEKSNYIVESSKNIQTIDDLLRSIHRINLGHEKESRYLMHSLHSYKGKFHPQIVKGLINAAGVAQGNVVLDPFCGCGTTNLECFFAGIDSWGVDLNPLACLIARTRITSLTLDASALLETIKDFLSEVKTGIVELRKTTRKSSAGQTSIDFFRLKENAKDLEISKKPYIPNINRWFREDMLEELLLIRDRIDNVGNPETRDLFLVVLSSIVKEVSNWDSSQVRPYLMKKPRANVDVLSVFKENLLKTYNIIYTYSKLKEKLDLSSPSREIRNEDSRDLHFIQDNSIDLVLTSPPYANALPYLETDRLRSILIGLFTWKELKSLRSNEIGNREISPDLRKNLEQEFLDSCDHSFLPNDIVHIIKKILEENRKLPNKNFRRKNRAALLYKYFKDMNACLGEIHRVLKPGKHCIIIIGNNRVRAGDTWIEIPTDSTIKEMAIRNFGFAMGKRIDKELVHTAHPRKIENETITFLKK